MKPSINSAYLIDRTWDPASQLRLIKGNYVHITFDLRNPTCLGENKKRITNLNIYNVFNSKLCVIGDLI